ncbi:hypothetical protein Tco_0348139 [Tanacetum coccineum]
MATARRCGTISGARGIWGGEEEGNIEWDRVLISLRLKIFKFKFKIDKFKVDKKVGCSSGKCGTVVWRERDVNTSNEARQRSDGQLAVVTTVAGSDSEKGENYPLVGGGDPNRQIVARKGALDFRFKMESEVVSEVHTLT